MCGIAGIVNLNGAPFSEESEAPLLHRLTRRIAHRGPDDEQIHVWANVGLGFRRLSIVDPSGGRQPLFNADRSVALICNGEIYNHHDLRSRFAGHHRFETESDCEIIAHLYEEMGMDMLDHLNGIFAFALLDQTTRKLYLCRDRLGVKPLFYHCDADILVFGSEVKAVLAHPAVAKRFDWAAALTFRDRMHYPHQSQPLTSFFHGIHHLPAGHFLEINLTTGAIREQVYWDAATVAAGKGEPASSREDYIRRYRDLLADSVRLQLIADVECGVFLSGGIDSVAVAHFASAHRALHSFTVLSQSTLTNGDAPFARAASKSFGLPNHMMLYDWRDAGIAPSLWRTILWAVEMPMAGAEQFYKYLLHASARERVPGLKVMLLGSGSDEFNGGYSKSVFNSVEHPSWRTFERVLGNHERSALLQRSGAWNCYAQARVGETCLIRDDFLAELAQVPRCRTAWHGYRDMYRRLLQMYQLWHEDRTSSAHGIEARVPFLDHRIVELTYSVPAELHHDLFWDKTILREAMSGSLADHFTQRPKTPFFFGEDIRYTRRLMYNLLCANGNALVEEAIEEASHVAGVIDRDALWEMVRRLPEDPEYANLDLVLDLVNMGLLAALAKAEPAMAKTETLPVKEVAVDDWASLEQQFGVSLIRRSPTLDRGSVLRFADGVRVVRSVTGDRRLIDAEEFYILRHNQLEFAIEPDLEPWIGFLREVDGARSVDQVLKAAGVDAQDIWKHLEEAVEYDILNLVPGLREPVPLVASRPALSPLSG
ncbi:asparagine synthase (glutamine-hydrolyzing) [Bradyrhizobium brasilense]|uniref:asparagine synthase (glutamine-hydrolyzing) n=1 Tax=Bradyrhizobium brasilense TaxID=1419277 RepID=UPI0028775BFD|nr:asparagine synthase (glutamine-hydrolyzing) [Bradyrhizobium brasilense]MCP3417939.1 asparagine synthase (glutamine-hydrolyzing) [Bradyrhizobium brasilense]